MCSTPVSPTVGVVLEVPPTRQRFTCVIQPRKYAQTAPLTSAHPLHSSSSEAMRCPIGKSSAAQTRWVHPPAECSGDVHAVWAAITSHPNRRAAVNYRLQTDAELTGAPPVTPTGSAAWHRPPHWRSTPGPGRGVADTHGHLGYCRHSPVVLQTRTVLEGTAGTHGWWQKVARAYAVDVTGGGWSASAAASHRPHSAGVSALMAACKNGNADAVRLLLAFGPCPSRPLLVPSPLPPVARPANTCPAAIALFFRNRARGLAAVCRRCRPRGQRGRDRQRGGRRTGRAVRSGQPAVVAGRPLRRRDGRRDGVARCLPAGPAHSAHRKRAPG